MLDIEEQQRRWYKFLDQCAEKDCIACKHSGLVPDDYLCQKPNKDTECIPGKVHFEPRERPWNIPPDDPKEFCEYPPDCDGICIALRGDGKIAKCTHYRPEFFIWKGQKFIVKGLPVKAGDGTYIYHKR